MRIVRLRNFHEGECVAIVPDEVELSFDTAWSVVSCDENVAETAQIPISIGFAAKAAARGPMHGTKH